MVASVTLLKQCSQLTRRTVKQAAAGGGGGVEVVRQMRRVRVSQRHVGTEIRCCGSQPRVVVGVMGIRQRRGREAVYAGHRYPQRTAIQETQPSASSTARPPPALQEGGEGAARAAWPANEWCMRIARRWQAAESPCRQAVQTRGSCPRSSY